MVEVEEPPLPPWLDPVVPPAALPPELLVVPPLWALPPVPPPWLSAFEHANPVKVQTANAATTPRCLVMTTPLL
jgi:hypothetical protein